MYLFNLSFDDFKFGYASCVAYTVAVARLPRDAAGEPPEPPGRRDGLIAMHAHTGHQRRTARARPRSTSALSAGGAASSCSRSTGCSSRPSRRRRRSSRLPPQWLPHPATLGNFARPGPRDQPAARVPELRDHLGRQCAAVAVPVLAGRLCLRQIPARAGAWQAVRLRAGDHDDSRRGDADPVVPGAGPPALDQHLLGADPARARWAHSASSGCASTSAPTCRTT